ncbi:hypothetical protein IAU60_000318 [Kwoniella sp. DSM 27419]
MSATHAPASGGPSNPLGRAHALSAQASQLLRPTDPELRSLSAALRLYDEATELFEAAASDAKSATASGSGQEEARTLRMLHLQHRKLAREVQRRIDVVYKDRAAVPGDAFRTKDSSAAAQGADPVRPGQRRVVSETAAPVRGMAGMSGPGPARLTSQALPPFALRPQIPVTSPVVRPAAHTALAGDRTDPTLSPLYSSSSSSSAPEESYIHFGPPPDLGNLDPFSRFWGMLENMLEEVSNPVVFASAPMEATAAGSSVTRDGQADDTVKGKNRKKRETAKNHGDDDIKDTEDSFYVVRRGKERDVCEEDDSKLRGADSTATSTKTAEELLMENASLKSSLDAMAVHAQSVDQANKALRAQLEERDRGLRLAMEGMKREALKGQEMLRSQLMSASVSSARATAGFVEDRGAGANVLGAHGRDNVSQKRIKELEEEVRSLKEENEKYRTQVDKYKARIDKIKLNAKAKKEAKLAAQGGSVADTA